MPTCWVPTISSNDFCLPDGLLVSATAGVLLNHGLSMGSSLRSSLRGGLSHGEMGRGLLDKDTQMDKTDSRAKLQFCPGGKGKQGGEDGVLLRQWLDPQD